MLLLRRRHRHCCCLPRALSGRFPSYLGFRPQIPYRRQQVFQLTLHLGSRRPRSRELTLDENCDLSCTPDQELWLGLLDCGKPIHHAGLHNKIDHLPFESVVRGVCFTGNVISNAIGEIIISIRAALFIGKILPCARFGTTGGGFRVSQTVLSDTQER